MYRIISFLNSFIDEPQNIDYENKQSWKRYA